MSIGQQVVQQVNRINNEVETQKTLMENIDGMLDDLGAERVEGGAQVEMCTVTIGRLIAGDDIITLSSYTTLENDSIQFIEDTKTITSGEQITIDVVKNTTMQLMGNTLKIEGGIRSIFYENEASSDRTVFFVVTGDCTIIGEPCFVYNTKILLTDYTTKPVQDITYNDELLVWDFDNGCYASAKPIWIKKTQTTDSYYRCTFDNGAELKLVGSNGRCHRVFSLDRNMFESATECVGEQIITTNGIAKLVSCERVEETVDFYNVITNKHINLFAEGVLTSCRLNNLYPVQDMKFVKDDRELLPIESYGEIDERFYSGLRLAEQSAENIDMITGYVKNLVKLMES